MPQPGCFGNAARDTNFKQNLRVSGKVHGVRSVQLQREDCGTGKGVSVNPNRGIAAKPGAMK